MLNSLQEYDLGTSLTNDGIISVYRAVNKSSGKRCILKLPANDTGYTAAAPFLKNEYAICCDLDHPGILRASRLIRTDGGCINEYRDIDGVPLALSMHFGSLETGPFLDTAIFLSELLAHLHDRGITHRNISPFSIIKNISTGEYHLTSFYISAMFSDSDERTALPSYYPPNAAYIAPEQSGKVDRPVDERSDLYALGAVWYEMLCGDSPFVAADLASLIYSHVAKKPVSLVDRNKNIPRPVADIVGKLLEKNPADRYQSAYGVQADLEECRNCLRNGRSLTGFSPGKQDRITRLFPIKKLYGRHEELQQLTSALKEAQTGTCSCMLIYGEAGTGKTCLVNALAQTVDPGTILIARGKCDAASTALPYHSLKEAISDLIASIIARGDNAVSFWKTILLEHIGDIKEIIADFIPEIRMIIGPTSKRTIPIDGEAGTQFKDALIRFIRAFSTSGYTFVIFIDDLQWADSALLNILVPAFFDSPSRKLLFIGSTRPPFDKASELTRSIVGGSTIKVRTIDLAPLSIKDTGAAVDEALGGTRGFNHEELDALIYRKTNGNPFFVKTFLETLLAKNLLFHKPSATAGMRHGTPTGDRWQWDTAAINRLSCTENVIDLIIEKTRTLSPPTQRILTIAAGIGMRFTVSNILTISGLPHEEVDLPLSDACDAGILQFESPADTSGRLCFVHDRIREAIYNRIDPEERRTLHLTAGRALLEVHRSNPTTVSVFDILKHLNRYADSITSQEERGELARLNHEAGIEARNANAMEIAIVHFMAAVGFLPGNAWKTDQEFRFSLELHLAECEFQFSRHDDALHRCSALEQFAATGDQHAVIDLLRMSIYNHLQQQQRAIDIGLKRLRAMGINIPSRPSIPFLITELIKSAFSIRRLYRDFSRQQPVPGSEPGSDKYAFRIMSRLWLDAFTLEQQGVVVAITTYLINTARTTGLSGPFSVACCFWGIFLGKITGNPLKGQRYGTMAMNIANNIDDMFSRGITYFLYGSFFAHLEGSLDNALAILTEGQKYSYEAGDLVSTSNSNEGKLLYQVLNGTDLPTINQSTVDTHDFLLRIGNPHKALNVVRYIRDWANEIENNLAPDFASRIDDPEKETPLVKGIYLFYLMFSEVIRGDYDAALVTAHRLRRNPLLDPSSYFHQFFSFLSAIARSGAHTGQDVSSVKRFLERKRSILKKGTKISAATSKPLLLLVTAEYYRCSDNRWEALSFYRQAVDASRASGFLHVAALSCERAASFMQPYNMVDSRSFLKNAITYYHEWGAHAKVAQLRREAPDIPFTPPEQMLLSGFNTIDIQTLLKSFEAISNELLLDRLLEKLIRIVMENVGARRGVLLLHEQDALNVRVEGVLRQSDDQHGSIESHACTSALNAIALPNSIISYVMHSREPVRLEQASRTGRFTTDPYVTSNAAKSILCVPLIANERIRGIIYLENNMTEGAFPPSRLQLLRLLCAQAIISIDNALFHEVEIKHLQAKVNPHFIFNALSSVAELCHTDPVATEDAIVKLSILYRYVLSAEMRLVSLDEELAIVDKYIDIEKLRFGERLTFEKHIEGTTDQVKMPSMLIQPLVENSIKHGITPRPSGGTISLLVIVTDARCTVTVADNGVGTSVAAVHGSGYGLESIRKRLALHYKNEAILTISDAAGYKVEFSFPLQLPKE